MSLYKYWIIAVGTVLILSVLSLLLFRPIWRRHRPESFLVFTFSHSLAHSSSKFSSKSSFLLLSGIHCVPLKIIAFYDDIQLLDYCVIAFMCFVDVRCPAHSISRTPRNASFANGRKNLVFGESIFIGDEKDDARELDDEEIHVLGRVCECVRLDENKQTTKRDREKPSNELLMIF